MNKGQYRQVGETGVCSEDCNLFQREEKYFTCEPGTVHCLNEYTEEQPGSLAYSRIQMCVCTHMCTYVDVVPQRTVEYSKLRGPRWRGHGKLCRQLADLL